MICVRLTATSAARWIGLIVHGDGGHAAQRQRASQIAARRPRGLYRQRKSRRRHYAPGVPQCGANGGGALRHEGRSGASRGHDLRGGWRAPFHLFPPRALARGFAAAHDRPSAYCRFHLRPVRALAGPRRLLHHRHGDEPGRAAGAQRPSRQRAALLQARPRQRSLCGLRGAAAAGGARSEFLYQAKSPGADAARGARGG